MKKIQILLTALIVTGSVALAQAQNFYPVLKKYTPADKEKLDKLFSIQFKSGHNGFIESSLAIVTMVKLDVPGEEFPKIEEDIKRLIVRGATPSIRYKAYLANMVFENPGMFKEEATRKYKDEEALFSALSERVSKTLFSSN